MLIVKFIFASRIRKIYSSMPNLPNLEIQKRLTAKAMHLRRCQAAASCQLSRWAAPKRRVFRAADDDGCVTHASRKPSTDQVERRARTDSGRSDCGTSRRPTRTRAHNCIPTIVAHALCVRRAIRAINNKRGIFILRISRIIEELMIREEIN